jgi:hypothetical protein
MTNLTWGGTTVLDGPLAIVVCDPGPASVGDSDLITPIAVASLDRAVLLDPRVLGDFLVQHGETTIACFDVASTFDRIETLLRDHGDEHGMGLLLELVRSCRLHDIQVLYQLLDLARYGTTSKPPALEQVLEFSIPDRSAFAEGEDIAGPEGPSGLVWVMSEVAGLPHPTTAGLILRAYRALRLLADRVAESLQIDESLVETFGPLSAGLESQGAIALSRMGRRGLRLQSRALDQLEAACERAHGDCSRRLLIDHAARKAFHRKGGVIEREATTGYPRQKPRELRGWLQAELEATSGISDIPPEPPRTREGKISVLPDFWGDLVHRRQLLRDWADLWAAAKVGESLRESRAKGDGMVRPSYELFPRLVSRNPPLEGFRGLGMGPAFEPEPGMTFLIGKLPGLLLRSFAQLDLQLGRGSLISHEIDFRADPIDALAARLYARDLARREYPTADLFDLETVGQFHDLDDDSTERQRWRQIAGVLLDAVLGRLDAPAARMSLERNFRIIYDASSMQRLWNDVVEILSNLIRSHGEDPTLELASHAIGCYEFELEDAIRGETPSDRLRFLRDLLRGRVANVVAFERIAGLCRDERLAGLLRDRLGSPELYRRIFAGYAATGTGRVRQGGFFATDRYDGLSDLVEDATKAALFEVVAAGFDLVGWAGPEFAIQVAERVDVPTEALRLKEAAERGAARVLDRFPPACHVVPAAVW